MTYLLVRCDGISEYYISMTYLLVRCDGVTEYYISMTYLLVRCDRVPGDQVPGSGGWGPKLGEVCPVAQHVSRGGRLRLGEVGRVHQPLGDMTAATACMTA